MQQRQGLNRRYLPALAVIKCGEQDEPGLRAERQNKAFLLPHRTHWAAAAEEQHPPAHRGSSALAENG